MSGNEQEAKAEYVLQKEGKNAKSSKIDFRRYSMKDAKDYQQALRAQLARKSDPEGKIVLEPQSSSEMVRSCSRPSYNVTTNRSSRLRPNGEGKATSNRLNMPSSQDVRSSFIKERQGKKSSKMAQRKMDSDRSKSREPTTPASTLSSH